MSAEDANASEEDRRTCNIRVRITKPSKDCIRALLSQVGNEIVIFSPTIITKLGRPSIIKELPSNTPIH